MNISRTMIRVIGILLLFIAIGWYGNLEHISKVEIVIPHKHKMTYDEANAKLVKPVSRSQKYYYQKVEVTRYTRTLIPFKYKKASFNTEKKYYSY